MNWVVNWLKENVFIATWISASITALGTLWKIHKAVAGGQPINWTQAILFFICLSSFTVVITPKFDTTARSFAITAFMVTIIWLRNTRNE